MTELATVEDFERLKSSVGELIEAADLAAAEIKRMERDIKTLAAENEELRDLLRKAARNVIA